MKKIFIFFLSITFFLSCEKPDKNQVEDIDGNIYNTIQVGNTIWMAENLRTTHYQNGDPIIHLEDSTEWVNTTSGAFCFYDNNDSIENIYGKLYNWFSVDDERNICPTGWQVPSYRDFMELDSAFGGMGISGKALKLENELWYENSSGSNNISGFSAIPGGHRNINNFERIRNTAFFWNREDNFNDFINYIDCCAHECSLRAGESFFLQDAGYKYRGFSIRCVKNGFQKPDSIIQYSYRIIDKKKEEILKDGNFEMYLTNDEWLPWDKQLKLIYKYDIVGNNVINQNLKSETGWRKNNDEFYIHPPRSYDLEILEYAPFPFVNFDKSVTAWVDTFRIPENSGWEKDLDNSIFYQDYKVLKNDEFNYRATAVSIRNTDTSFIKYNYNFKRGFTNYEYDILDSLIVIIKQK